MTHTISAWPSIKYLQKSCHTGGLEPYRLAASVFFDTYYLDVEPWQRKQAIHYYLASTRKWD